jgi:hypothetical protein
MKSKTKPPTPVTVLSDIQNACIEAAQESKHIVVTASDVVDYVEDLWYRDEGATINRRITKVQASRALQGLHNMGIFERQPRASAGWGNGWWPSVYRLVAP